MTPPVLFEGAPGAVPVSTGAVVPTVTDPALAAEFAALLGAAMPEAIPVAGLESDLVAPPLEVPPTEVALGAAPPGPAPNTIPEDVATIPGREGEKEAARSAAPEKILDSASLALDRSAPDRPASELTTFVPSLLGGFVCILQAPTLAPPAPQGPVTASISVVSETLPGVPQVAAKVALPEGLNPFGGLDSPTVVSQPREFADASGDIVTTEATIPDAHLADVTAISGGAAQFGADERDGRGRSDEEHATGEVTLGEATNLITDRSEKFEVTRTERPEARPLDRTERARIVHQVIDRVTKHVETLAVSRSKEPLTIRLEPADLGRVVVEVSREASGLVAEMSASDPRVVKALDRHRSELAAGLAARGHAEARVTVNAAPTADNPAFDLRREGGQSPQHQHQHQPQRQSQAPNAPTSFARPSDRPRIRVRAAGLDLEI